MTTEAMTRLKDGYTFDGATLELGVALDGETPAPDVPIAIPLAMLNRHGLVAGATGTGKTVTLQVLAEQLSKAGVPVFASDIKGDLSGIGAPGVASEKLTKRLEAAGQEWDPAANPTEFYTLGDSGLGTPIRATVTSFGPILLSKVLELNDTQESVLSLVFHYADKAGLALLDLSDLRAVLTYLTSDEGKAELEGIGGASKATVGVILRKIAELSAQGGDVFFGEPEFDTADLLRVDDSGAGIVSVLELQKLNQSPALFSTFLMWLLADLFQDLPEVGDADKPALVFFFDEAHLLFADASKAFLESVTQTVRLIRSKGVGVFFVTQTPKDVPEDVLAQLGSRIQHQLRAHTPNDAKALKATVATFPKSDYDLESLLTSLGIGEAVVTVMDLDGAPTPVAATRVRAPESKIGPMSEDEIKAAVAASDQQKKYGTAIDNESAREILTKRLEAGAAEQEAEASQTAGSQTAGTPTAGSPTSGGDAGRGSDRVPFPEENARAPRQQDAKAEKKDDNLFSQVVNSSAFKQFTRTAAREIARGIFGTSRRRR
ncbi:helicase HerA-like domain-containing protein [Brevibacterium sp. NPDC059310]|uniref:helicase HerA-like domain-containing protein n=1 Tax=Brevibacterium sp. NPDC059310 TaxID=3346802 RepID=UPI00366DC7D1